MNDPRERLRNLRGLTLQTVRGKPFRVVSVTASELRVVPESTGKEHPIRRADIEAALELARAGKDISPIRLREAGVSEYDRAYVSAIARLLSHPSQQKALHNSFPVCYPADRVA